MNPLLHPLAVESTLQTEHLVEPPTNRFGCVGGVHPKPLPTGYGSLMGFAWAILVSSEQTDPLNALPTSSSCWMGFS